MEVGWAVGNGGVAAGDDNHLGAQHRLLLSWGRGDHGGSAGVLLLNLSIANLVGERENGGSKR